MSRAKLAVVVVLALAVGAFFALDLGQYLRLDYFKGQQAAIEAYARENPLQSAAAYFAVYVAVTALSFPGAAILTLADSAAVRNAGSHAHSASSSQLWNV